MVKKTPIEMIMEAGTILLQSKEHIFPGKGRKSAWKIHRL